MIRKLTAVAVTGVLLATPVVAQVGGNVEERGRAVFFSQGCYGCHRLGMAGTPIAYDLSRIGQKYTPAELERWLRDPVSQKPTAHMPRLALSEDEIHALAAYLGSLR